MKKIILVLICCISCIHSFSQTKSETEKWILEKIRGNIQDYNESHRLDPTDWSSFEYWHRHYDYSFDFDSDNLVIQYKNRYHVGESVHPSGVKEDQVKILIPVNDIIKISKVSQESVYTPKKYVTCNQIKISTQTYSIRNFRGDFEELKNGSEIITLSIENDENLAERLEKAFFHLKQYYPKKQKEIKKETF